MLFNIKNFKELRSAQPTDTPCVSIFIPTHRAGHVQEDKIRFKNALAEARNTLQEDGLFVNGRMIERDVEEFLAPAYGLLDTPDLWVHLSDGLAVFIGKGRFEYYTVPISFAPLSYVKHHFYLRPLIPLLNRDTRFFLLALSQGSLRFFEGSQYSITPVTISDLTPANIEEALEFENPEKSLQMRTAGREGTAVYHGHGIHKDQQDWQIEQYCRMVDDGLMKMLHDENAPMIIAAVDELASVYQKVSTYSRIVDYTISGNPENDGPVQLHEKAWSKLKDHFQREFNKQKEYFAEALAKGLASFSIHDIAPAAVNGKVQTLFIAKDAPVLWGSYNESTNSINIHEKQNPQSICLYGLTAVKTFEQGGIVYNIAPGDFPREGSQVYAIYRY